MTCHRSAQAAAQTIFDIYERASCPLRITVCVWQETERDDSDVWGIYQNLSKSHAAAPSNGFSDKLRVLNHAARDSPGPLHATTELFRRCHTTESTVLIIQPGVLVCDDWDLYVNANHGNRVYGQIPGRMPVDVGALKVGTAGELLRTVLVTSQLRPADEHNATYPCYMPHANVPILVSRPFPEPKTCRIIGTSMLFTFCSAALFTKITSPVGLYPHLPLYAADYYLSAALHRAGGEIFSIPATICVGSATAIANTYRPSDWKKTALPVPKDYAKFCGATTSRVSGRALLGLTPDLIYGIDKYGSKEELERHTRTFKK